ncbi:DNA cytosine methyltransferase [Micromonospora sp. WMMD1219]|uniref:DNA cytosine methyltransferase n=1 Tax=Micromonospora sp. WMMD1219 TaxID=3404115 RepID=UPI003BF46B80
MHRIRRPRHGRRAGVGGQLTWYAETDRHATTVCAHHRPGVANLGDIRAIDRSQVPPVDVLTAGLPCTQ